MKRILSAVCCIVLCSIPALGQKKAAGMTMTDQQFVDFAAQTDMIEANLGQLAGNVSDSQPVKDYAQMLVTDHTNDMGQLSTAAQQASLTVPTSIDAAHNKTMIDPFQKLKGAAFDHRYIQEMIAGHTKAIAVYKKEAADAQNPSIKSYAQATLPTLEKHLSGAKDLEKSKGKAAATKMQPAGLPEIHRKTAYQDNSNHLCATSQASGKLFVFTTPTGYSQAAGSPHTISNPEALIVRPKPWY